MKYFYALFLTGMYFSFNFSLMAADAEAIKYSTWNTTYKDDAGTFSVNAVVTLDGATGTYVTASGQHGTLEELHYAYLSPAPELRVGVYGVWRMNGQDGGFTFRIDGTGQILKGQWSQGSIFGSWDGVLAN